MKNWRSSNLATIGGIMAGFAGIPIAWGAAINAHIISTSYQMPGWFFLLCVSLGVLGPVVIGVAAKGQDDHATPAPPPDQAPQLQQQQPPALKMVLIALCLLVFAVPSRAQSITNLYAAGVSYNSAGTPAIAGTALYAHQLGDTGTYAFTAVDALPTSFKPFVVTTNISAGVAQKVFSLGKVPIFVPTSAGVSFNGTNTGWAWSTGALASIKLGAKSNWRIFPTVRIAKSSVSNGTGYQPIVGILFGWGQ